MKDNQLIESVPDADAEQESENALRARLDKLEYESREHRRLTEQRAILAELKVVAIRAGIVDLDGLKFLDTSQISLDENGGVVSGAELIDRLKHAKPWLFSISSSSSIATAPPARPARQKLAKEMTDAEYRIARANIIKRSTF